MSVSRPSKRTTTVRKTDKQFELALTPQLLIGVLGVVGVLALVLVGFAIGRRGTTPTATTSTGNTQYQAGQTISVPAGSVDSSTTNMVVAPQPDVETKHPVSEKEQPIGDAPRLALPDLAGTNYAFGFGKITNPDKITRTFTIKNIGQQPLNIGSVSSSCGCTAALIADKVVPPNGESKFQVEFDPTVYKDANTYVNAWVTINSNDPLAPTVRVDLSGEVLLKK